MTSIPRKVKLSAIALAISCVVEPAIVRATTAPEFEIGENDFRISSVGPDGNTGRDGEKSAVAYNSSSDELLVVWQGNDTANDLEIWGQLIDAATGGEIGTDFRISSMGPDGNANYVAQDPSVAYNPTADEYLVVWEGNDTLNDREIWAQLVNGTTGELSGENYRISDLGPPENAEYDARNPDVVYNPDADDYLVVWHGDDDQGALVEGENEIWGQRLRGSNGTELGTNDFRISLQGPNGEKKFDAESPALVYNPTSLEYFVVWEGDDEFGNLVNGENEIWGQRLAGSNAAKIGNDFRITSFGPNGNEDCDAVNADIAFNSVRNEFLLVWQGDDFCGQAGTETEVFSNRLSETGAKIGGERTISQMGPDSPGFDPYDAEDPAVVFFEDKNEYFVVWSGDDNSAPLVNDEFEIFGQRVNGASGQLVEEVLRLSDLGPDSTPSFDAVQPTVISVSNREELLVVFSGDDDIEPQVEGEQEIFGQRLDFKVPANLTIDSLSTSCNGDDTLTVSVTVGNSGGRDAQPFAVGVYGSLSPQISTDDTLIGTVTFDSGVGGNLSADLEVDLPTADVLDGTYYLGAIADFEGLVPESDETDNGVELDGEPIILPCASASCALTDTDLILEDQTLNGTQVIEACYTITLGPGLTISSAAAIKVRAGQGVVMGDGVTLEEGAGFIAEIDPELRQ